MDRDRDRDRDTTAAAGDEAAEVPSHFLTASKAHRKRLGEVGTVVLRLCVYRLFCVARLS